MQPGADSEEAEPAEPTKLMGRRTGLVVVVTVALANASNYGFQLITGRSLGAEAYGLLASLMSVISIVGISTGSLQQVAAKAITAGDVEPSPRTFDRLTRSTIVGGLAGTAVFAALSPLLSRFLNVGVLPLLIVAAYITPAALSSISIGRLQGQLRFVAMSLLSASFAVVKFGVGLGVVIAGLGVTTVVAGLVAGTTAVAVGGLWWSRSAGSVTRGLVDRDSMRVFGGVTLFWVVVNAGVPFARSNFPEQLAGQYAAAAVIGSAVLWLPAVITQIAFPQVSQAVTSNKSTGPLMLRAFAISVGLSASGALGIWLFGSTIFRVLYGDEYVLAAGFAWKLAVATVPLAVVNLLLHHHLARVGYRYLPVLALAAALEIAGLAAFGTTPTSFAVIVGAVGCLTVVALLPPGGWRLVKAQVTRVGTPS